MSLSLGGGGGGCGGAHPFTEPPHEGRGSGQAGVGGREAAAPWLLEETVARRPALLPLHGRRCTDAPLFYM